MKGNEQGKNICIYARPSLLHIVSPVPFCTFTLIKFVCTSQILFNIVCTGPLRTVA